MKNPLTTPKTVTTGAVSACLVPDNGLYRLLAAGEILQARDAVYRPGEDHWQSLSELNQEGLIGAPYEPTLGPVRRFTWLAS